MKLSTKGRYGLRLMLELALHSEEGPVLLRDIAQRQEISEKYLWQLIAKLKKAGLVNSLRGASKGYALARTPSEITLKDIISVLEGDICLVDCVNNPNSCKRAQTCVSREVWKEVNDNLLGTLASFTLKEIAERQKFKKASLTYAI